MGKLAKIAIEVEVGPEVITGSTRMKAGTAQKNGVKYYFNWRNGQIW